MKKKREVILASIAIFAMIVVAIPAFASPSDRDLPLESDPFWTIFAAMDSPTDYSGCIGAVTTYVSTIQDEGQRQGELSGMSQMCTEFQAMPSQMQSDMASDGATTSLFDSGNTDWHHISNLYFQKTENGELKGRISFSESIDFMSYDFMSFMNNFGNMVQFYDGYISLNSSMVGDMSRFGATLTMFGLDFSEQPDIYVSDGQTMRKAVEGQDLSGINYDANAGTLSFTPAHFSSFKAVQKGGSLGEMKIKHVNKRGIKYKAKKNSFKIKVKGSGFTNGEASCLLGFNEATSVKTSSRGKKVTCTFSMSDFSQTGYYPLTISVAGVGEVIRSNAIRIK